MSGTQTAQMMPTLSDRYDTSPDLPYEHAEDIGRQWWHDHPDAAELLRRAEAARQELARATDAAREARLWTEELPDCTNSVCVRKEHPGYEPHENAEGNTWFPGWAPR